VGRIFEECGAVMLPYLIIWTASICAYKFAIKSTTGFVRVGFLLFCILLPSFLAGFRDESMGLDWNGYGIQVWNLALTVDSFSSFLLYNSEMELGYKLLNYVVASFSTDCHVFFFVHQLLLVSLAVFISYQYKDDGFSEIILIFYYLYLYNTSFTMLRQSVALMFFFCSVCLWDKGKIHKSIILSVLANLSHNSALFSILYFPFLKLKTFLQKKKATITIVMVVASFFAVAAFSSILSTIIEMNIFSEHYTAYIDQIGEVKSHKIEIVFLLSVIASLFVFTTKKNRNEPIFTQIYFLVLIALLFQFFGNITDVAFRVAHYFVIPVSIFLPKISTNRWEVQKVCQSFFVLLFTRFICLILFDRGAENTIPYMSKLLGI
jgi:hypothetical protein